MQRNKGVVLMSEKKEILLSNIEAGRRVKLIRVNAGAGLKSRLAVMGILPGGEFEVMSNGHPGPFVVKAKGTKMVLGRGMAHRVLVEIVG